LGYDPIRVKTEGVAILWSYVVDPEHVPAFERAYGPDGPWAALFQKSPDYLGTEFFRDTDGAYVTIDRWRSTAAYEAFLREHATEYHRIDAACEALTKSERAVGRWTAVRVRVHARKQARRAN
jgi:hypothetical protein